MAKTYAALMAEADALMAKAEALKAKEKAKVIQKIKVAVDHYGLTAADLGVGKPARKGSAGKPVQAARKSPKGSTAKYGDGNGNTWTGMGPRPRWFKAALDSGRAPESMLIGMDATPSPRKGKPVAPKYRGDAGNIWSGRGPRPKWFRDALASGKSLEQLAIA